MDIREEKEPMTYIIDDSSITSSKWAERVERKSKYIVISTSQELQHLSNADLRLFMSKGIKTEFIRCSSLEDIYMQVGFQMGKAFASGYMTTLISDSPEYDSYICAWQKLGLNVIRESS